MDGCNEKHSVYHIETDGFEKEMMKGQSGSFS